MMSEEEFMMEQGKLVTEITELLNKYMYLGMKTTYSNLWKAEAGAHETYKKLISGF
jgi:hypothetical protein